MQHIQVKILRVSVLLLLLVVSASCVTTDVGQIPRLIETKERMFWEIQGTSADGTPSSVYILGTIHIGDERLYPLSEPVKNTFVNADRIVGELSSADIINIQVATTEKFLQAASASMRGTDPLTNYLTQKEIDFLENIIGTTEVLDAAYLFDPWFLLMILSIVELEKIELSSEYGLDFVLYAFAKELGIEVEGLDTLKTQMDIILYDGFSFKEQLEILQDALKNFMRTEPHFTADDMYEMYISNNKKAMAEFFVNEENLSATLQKYIKILLSDRNSAWAQKISLYIEEGGTTFIFAGVGHFVGDNSVFDYMKRDGVLRN